MRIKQKTVNELFEAISEIYTDKYELRLYGSRLDESRKGGDIDLLLIVPAQNLKNLQLLKPEILVAMKSHIGEQRIDLTISSLDCINQNNFLKSIFEDSVILAPKNA